MADKADDLSSYFGKIGKEIGEAFLSNIDAGKIAEKMAELEISGLKIAKTFGQGREQIVAIKTAMADANVSVALLGGNFQDIVKIQDTIGEKLKRNLIIMSETYADLYATTKVTGVETQTLVTSFKNAGYSLYSIEDQMLKAVSTARSMGVNVSAVSKLVAENLEKINLYGFEKGVAGLAKMAAQASVMNLDMGQVFGIAEKLFSPEQAIDIAASLQRLGVMQSDLLDPLRLMDLAQNDVAELQNQLVQMAQGFAEFNEEAGRFEIPPGARRQLKEIAEALGFNSEQMSKMAISAADLDLKISKISFPEIMTDEQKQLIANMAEMEGGEYKIKFQRDKTEVTKSIAELTKEDIEAITEGSKPVEMQDLAKSQLSVAEEMLGVLKSIDTRMGFILGTSSAAEELTRTGKDINKFFATMSENEAVSVKTGREAANTITDEIVKIMKGESKLTLEEALKNVGAFGMENFQKLYEGGSEAFKELADSNTYFSAAIKNAMENLKATQQSPNTGNTQVQVNDFILQTHPEDKIVMVGGTNLDGAKPGTTPPMQGRINGDVNLNIKFDVPPNMDVSKLREMMQDSGVMQQIIDSFINTIQNDGVMGQVSPTEKRSRLMSMTNRQTM
jgi:hypothetical protein